MGVNKVIYGSNTVIDITDSTVTPKTLAKGVIAYNASGNKIVGELNVKFYTNQVPISIGDDKKPYNGGLGYKNGYRVRSGGVEADAPNGSCTGYIPCKNGDVIRISGWNIKNSATENCVNTFDKNFTGLGQWSAQYSGGYGNLAGSSYAKLEAMAQERVGLYNWVVPPTDYGDIAYIRVSGKTNANGSLMIVTVNEEIN